MPFDLQPITEPGRRFVALAEAHTAALADRAAAHDKDGSFPDENIADLQSSGFMAACVPPEFGGLGVGSIHDVTVALNRLGRGDGSTAIAANMHTVFVFFMARGWSVARASDESERAARFSEFLTSVGRQEAIFCALNTEPGTDLFHPRCLATRVDGGWLLNGRKSFATLSAVATHGGVTFRMRDDDGADVTASAMLPMTRAGLEVHRVWDAMGMRASGSYDVVLTDCFVPEADVNVGGPVGAYQPSTLCAFMIANFGLLGTFLGIAETAYAEAVRLVASRQRSAGDALIQSPAIQHTVAEIEIDLAACRAMLTRTARAADAFLAEYPADTVPLAALHELMKDFQCTKWVVNRKAVEVVDRALQLSGGSGYLSHSVLSRLYRDVRAGAFMQPFSPNEAFQYIGKVALGLEPEIE